MLRIVVDDTIGVERLLREFDDAVAESAAAREAAAVLLDEDERDDGLERR